MHMTKWGLDTVTAFSVSLFCFYHHYTSHTHALIASGQRTEVNYHLVIEHNSLSYIILKIIMTAAFPWILKQEGCFLAFIVHMIYT